MRARYWPGPFLRWIGGKRRLSGHLLQHIPPIKATATYWEPFLGAASIFLALKPVKAVLGDINPDLIACYKRIQRNPDRLSKLLEEWRGDFSLARYYSAREEFNRARDGYRKSSLFMVLNRTCFNGIWRVNKKGRFNVPFGAKMNCCLPSAVDLRSYSEVFQQAEFLTLDFQQQLAQCRKGDFVYLDPPYPPLNGTSFFAHYTRTRFSLGDHDRVAATAKRLGRRGCRVMVSNAGMSGVLLHYRGFRVIDIPTTRYVAAGGVRHRVRDVAIVNFDEYGDLLPTAT